LGGGKGACDRVLDFSISVPRVWIFNRKREDENEEEEEKEDEPVRWL
jgi:hypothetical protein